MKCAVHSDVDAVGYCRNCGKAMCSTCVRPVRDVLYCEECLASIVGIPARTPLAQRAPLPHRALFRRPFRIVPAAARALHLSWGFCFPAWALSTTGNTTRRWFTWLFLQASSSG